MSNDSGSVQPAKPASAPTPTYRTVYVRRFWRAVITMWALVATLGVMPKAYHAPLLVAFVAAMVYAIVSFFQARRRKPHPAALRS